MSAVLTWGEFKVEIALPQNAPGLIWDEGQWDVNEWQRADTDLGDWLDISCDTVVPFTLKAGSSLADGVVTRWEAQTVSVQLLGADYDPRSGQWAGLLGPGLPLRMQWRPTVARVLTDLGLAKAATDDWQPVFTGQVTDNGYQWDPSTKVASLTVADQTAFLAAFDGVEAPAQGRGETAAQRVARILDYARWPAADRDITAGGVAVKSTTMADAAWAQLLAVADTDLALLWVRRDGRLAYRPQGRVAEGVPITARLVACPQPIPIGADLPYNNLLNTDPAVTRNWVSISRQKDDVQTPTPTEPVTVTHVDDASVARFRPHTYQRSDLQHTDDDWSATIADAVLADGAWPTTAPTRVDLDTRTVPDQRLSALLLELEPEHVFTVVDPTGREWRQVAIGWEITVRREYLTGSIYLYDVTGWGQTGGGWDVMRWDVNTWGLAGVGS